MMEFTSAKQPNAFYHLDLENMAWRVALPSRLFSSRRIKPETIASGITMLFMLPICQPYRQKITVAGVTDGVTKPRAIIVVVLTTYHNTITEAIAGIT